ncbi:glycerophosphodiester phosphodiesterase [Hymenobacter busanensis]|uniref:Glycerophosphodiester phosphodiesterase n=1 Tax=Hymenobacter busanensis TaxID=2607656 RepID=A0A7L4ZZL8_9BACT|nr:glycerophosphodiester phosphodiesterase family protein [Hymenobacter busanensis]KAA9332943.1 glycerophosphodiester phosphodiesterase [Hymenobacter busanensis]QHJ08383.1 glycerophosphodiester phosphodiesterase [Hymenobacter busanensis]
MRNRPLIFGHRGCRGLRPENTLPAFLHALDWAVDGLELDVVLSADGQVVVSHEPWLNHLICTGPAGQLLTAEEGHDFNLYQQYYELIQRCDCGLLQHPLFPDQRSQPAYKPLLREVFAAVDAYARVQGLPLPRFSIELKSSPAGDGLYHPTPDAFFAAVLRVVLQAQMLSRTTWLSFDHRVLQAAHIMVPGTPTCLLTEDDLPLPEHLRRLGFQPTFLGPSYTLLTDDLLWSCGQARLPIIAWTVNTEADLLRLATLGVHGLTTDYPNRAATVFNL